MKHARKESIDPLKRIVTQTSAAHASNSASTRLLPYKQARCSTSTCDGETDYIYIRPPSRLRGLRQPLP